MSPASAKSAYADALASYEAVVATKPNVERKGATMPYTSVNGNMFSLLTKTGALIIRLPAADREAFMKKYKTKVPVQYGAVMKEYVEVPASLLANTKELAPYFDASYRYTSALKAKPTRAKTAKTAKTSKTAKMSKTAKAVKTPKPKKSR